MRGWGWRVGGIGARFELSRRRDSPLTPTLSPQGRGNKRKSALPY